MVRRKIGNVNGNPNEIQLKVKMGGLSDKKTISG
jgi:hypothetical protein